MENGPKANYCALVGLWTPQILWNCVWVCVCVGGGVAVFFTRTCALQQSDAPILRRWWMEIWSTRTQPTRAPSTIRVSKGEANTAVILAPLRRNDLMTKSSHWLYIASRPIAGSSELCCFAQVHHERSRYFRVSFQWNVEQPGSRVPTYAAWCRKQLRLTYFAMQI